MIKRAYWCALLSSALPAAVTSVQAGSEVQSPAARLNAANTFTSAQAFNGFWRVDGSSLDPDSSNFNFFIQVYPGANSGEGDPRSNVVMRMGWNLTADGTREDENDAAFGTHLEQHYKVPGGGPTVFEHHISELIDANGGVHRMLGVLAPKDGISSGSAVSTQSDTINFYDFAGTQQMKFDFPANAINYSAALVHRYSTNNYAMNRQSNAANSAYLNLPYINADDRLELGGDFRFIANVPTTGTYGNIFGLIQAYQMPADGTLLKLSSASGVTGSFAGLLIEGTATGTQSIQNYNYGANADSNAAIDLYTPNAAGGDAKVRMRTQSGEWQAGIDHSAGDNYVISTGDLGTGDKLIINHTTGATTITPPTTCSGQPSGALWNNAGTPAICP